MPEMDSYCSGRRRCDVTIDDAAFPRPTTCNQALRVHLWVEYRCIKGYFTASQPLFCTTYIPKPKNKRKHLLWVSAIFGGLEVILTGQIVFRVSFAPAKTFFGHKCLTRFSDPNQLWTIHGALKVPAISMSFGNSVNVKKLNLVENFPIFLENEGRNFHDFFRICRGSGSPQNEIILYYFS